jgi:cellulose/xylan binding protein with CBM9 domain
LCSSEIEVLKCDPDFLTIDGNLSEWANIAPISMADNSGRTGGVDNTAKVKLAWDDTYLYAAYDVTDTELLAVQTTRDHANIFQDDEVELYIDPQGDGAGATSMTATDYQFLANVRDARLDMSAVDDWRARRPRKHLPDVGDSGAGLWQAARRDRMLGDDVGVPV